MILLKISSSFKEILSFNIYKKSSQTEHILNKDRRGMEGEILLWATY